MSAEVRTDPTTDLGFGGAPRRRRQSPRPFDTRGILLLLAALVVAAPTVALPSRGVWLGVKAFVLEAVGIILAVFVVSRGDWTRERLRAAVLVPANLAVLAFIGWVGVSAARADLPALAHYEAMRHLGGALLYFAVLYGISVRRHLEQMVGFLLLAGGVAALFAFVTAGETDLHRITGAFRNEQLLAAFLCLLVPLAVTASIAEQSLFRRSAAQAATVVMAAGVLVTQNRSAWAGCLVALLLMGGLYLAVRSGGKRVELRKHQLIVPVLMVVLAAGLFLVMSRTGGSLQRRAASFTLLKRDLSFQWRLGMWDKAVRMTNARPLTGWGIGSFPVQQALFYHPAAPSRQQREILATGVTLSENAHNTYLQLAAELGYPGLFVFLGLYGIFFHTAARAVFTLRSGYRQAILIGLMGAAAGQFVSGFGNPAWEFPECSLFFWVILGMGMAAAGVAGKDRQAGQSNDLREV